MPRIVLNYAEGYGWRPVIDEYNATTDEWDRTYTGEYWPDIPTAANMAAAHMLVLNPPPPPGPLLLED